MRGWKTAIRRACPSGARRSRQPIARALPETIRVTCCLLEEGRTPEEVAAERGLAVGTIYSHLERLLEDGEDLEWRKWVPTEAEETLRALRGLIRRNRVVVALRGLAATTAVAAFPTP